MNKWKNCPFCNNPVEVRYFDADVCGSDNDVEIVCWKCNILFTFMNQHLHSQTVEPWNNRVGDKDE